MMAVGMISALGSFVLCHGRSGTGQTVCWYKVGTVFFYQGSWSPLPRFLNDWWFWLADSNTFQQWAFQSASMLPGWVCKALLEGFKLHRKSWDTQSPNMLEYLFLGVWFQSMAFPQQLCVWGFRLFSKPVSLLPVCKASFNDTMGPFYSVGDFFFFFFPPAVKFWIVIFITPLCVASWILGWILSIQWSSLLFSQLTICASVFGSTVKPLGSKHPGFLIAFDIQELKTGSGLTNVWQRPSMGDVAMGGKVKHTTSLLYC